MEMEAELSIFFEVCGVAKFVTLF